jgi:hypothetical protein
MFVDLSGLGGATNLRHLRLSGSVHNWQAVAGMSSLQSVHVQRYATIYIPLAPRHLGGLQQLRTIDMHRDVCCAEDWRALAPLPLLEEVVFESVTIPDDAAPATVKRITCNFGGLLLEVPASSLEGCLGRLLLPRLHTLHVSVAEGADRLMLALAGHTALHSLSLGFYSDGAGKWAPQQLSRLPALENFAVLRAGLLDVGALLEDVAGSSSVRRVKVAYVLSVGAPAAEQFSRGLAALAAGACRHSLEALRVNYIDDDGSGGKFARVAPASMAQVAGLLDGRMGALQLVELEVALPASLRSADDVEEGLPELLRQLGAAGDWACCCAAPPAKYWPGRTFYAAVELERL